MTAEDFAARFHEPHPTNHLSLDLPQYLKIRLGIKKPVFLVILWPGLVGKFSFRVFLIICLHLF
jgi:hypothetical protein